MPQKNNNPKVISSSDAKIEGQLQVEDSIVLDPQQNGTGDPVVISATGNALKVNGQDVGLSSEEVAEDLATKADTIHTHTKADITDLDETDYAEAAHTHAVADITDFDPTDKADAVHTHTKADITDLDETDYATASHTHVVADITDLDITDLDTSGLAQAVHSHTKADITDLDETDYATAVHGHTKADITDFDESDYATAVHSHVIADITDFDPADFATSLDYAQVVVVDPNGDNTTADGTQEAPFATIGAAHTWLSANLTATTRAVIQLNPGLYTESPTITRARTLIKGSSSAFNNSSIINGAVTFDVPTQGTDVYVAAWQYDNVSGLAGVTVNGSVTATVVNVGLFSITDCRIATTSNSSTACSITGTTAPTLCYIQDSFIYSRNTSSTALSLSGLSYADIRSSNIYGGTTKALSITNSRVVSFDSYIEANYAGTTVDVVYSSGSGYFHPVNNPAGIILFQAFNTLFQNTTLNATGITVNAGGSVMTGNCGFLIGPGTGKAIAGAAGAWYLYATNTYAPNTNSTIDSAFSTGAINFTPAPPTHTHTKAQITDFTHTHAISDVTNLQTTLDGKAASSHTHAISDVTNLQTSLDALPTTYATTITGDGTATGFTVTHNGGTRDCIVQVQAVASPYARVKDADYSLEQTTTNSCTITFNTAPANAVEYRVLVLIF